MPRRQKVNQQLRSRKILHPTKHALESQKFRRILKINEALRTNNLPLLRQWGQEEGFVNDAIRRRVWPVLLRSEASLYTPLETYPDRHKDEGQVALDVPRSLNTYPQGLIMERKEALQSELQQVIVHVLRSCPDLHYYQGFHDVCTVFLLLFGTESASVLMEKVALYFLRDGMLETLEPILRELTLIDTLIRLQDEELYDYIQKADVLPYYCLSWVITWCSHDLDDFAKITRLFDLFLCSNPLMPVYFAVAVVLSRRDKVLSLPCDTSTIHSFLTKLPQDLDVDALALAAMHMEQTYPIILLQHLSGIGLDTVSAVNTYQHLWISLDESSLDSDTILSDTLSIVSSDAEARTILRLPNEKRIPLAIPVKPISEKEHAKKLLGRLHSWSSQDTMWAFLAAGAGVGMLALLLSQETLWDFLLF